MWPETGCRFGNKHIAAFQTTVTSGAVEKQQVTSSKGRPHTPSGPKLSLTTKPDNTSIQQQTFCCTFKLVCLLNMSLHSGFQWDSGGEKERKKAAIRQIPCRLCSRTFKVEQHCPSSVTLLWSGARAAGLPVIIQICPSLALLNYKLEVSSHVLCILKLLTCNAVKPGFNK